MRESRGGQDALKNQEVIVSKMIVQGDRMESQPFVIDVPQPLDALIAYKALLGRPADVAELRALQNRLRK